MLRILIEGFILYLLYRFIVYFIIPIYRTFSRARKQMRDVNNKMNEQMHRHNENAKETKSNPQHTNFSKSEAKEFSDEGEYIDYEEVE